MWRAFGNDLGEASVTADMAIIKATMSSSLSWVG
jgi:hypothetical protein